MSIEVKLERLDELMKKLNGVIDEKIILKTLTDGAKLVERTSKKDYLSGPRPTYLGVKTGRLRSSITATKGFKEGNDYIAKVGTNVEYAPVHEYGVSRTVQVSPHSRKSFRKQKFTQYITGTDRTVARSKYKKVRSGDIFVSGFTRRMEIKQRPFLRPALDTNRENILGMFIENISKQLEK